MVQSDDWSESHVRWLFLLLDWVNSEPFICKKYSELASGSIRHFIGGLLQTPATCTAVLKVQKQLGSQSRLFKVYSLLSPSSPVPEITWKRANGVPFPSKVKMKYSKAVLEIPSFQQDDTGGYECLADNKMGKNTATGRLAFYGTFYFSPQTKQMNYGLWNDSKLCIRHYICIRQSSILPSLDFMLLLWHQELVKLARG